MSFSFQFFYWNATLWRFWRMNCRSTKKVVIIKEKQTQFPKTETNYSETVARRIESHQVKQNNGGSCCWKNSYLLARCNWYQKNTQYNGWYGSVKLIYNSNTSSNPSWLCTTKQNMFPVMTTISKKGKKERLQNAQNWTWNTMSAVEMNVKLQLRWQETQIGWK